MSYGPLKAAIDQLLRSVSTQRRVLYRSLAPGNEGFCLQDALELLQEVEDELERISGMF